MSSAVLERRKSTAIVWLEQPGAGPNLLDRQLFDTLPGVLDRIEADDGIESLVIASRNPHGFLAGADITLFDELADRDETLALVLHAQQLIERVAGLAKPTVAAIDGPCAGGGLELALACDYRLASTDPRTSLSLPEVKLGLLPALGGTQRLPRLVGLRSGLELLMTGRKVYARAARRMGLIDSTIHAEGLERAAVNTARELVGGGGRRGGPGSQLERLLESTPARELVFRRAREQAERLGRGNYPAPGRILDTVQRTFGGALSEGLRVEAEAFADLHSTRQSRSLRHLFFLRAAGRKNPFSEQPLPVRQLAVIGAGLMGAGIAQVSAHPGGYRVSLRDETFELAARGKAAVHRGLSERVGKGLTAFERDAALQRVRLAVEGSSRQVQDLTIEAVPEDLELKRAVLREVEEHAPARQVFASNTSSLPIARIAEAAERPERVVGMHYFSPVPKMPLLEVVRGPDSSPQALTTAVEVGLTQGKAVIVVGDSPGFYVNRVLAPYLNEALLLLREGAGIDEVDEAVQDAGFPVGPFRLLDNVGLEVAAKVTGVLAPLFERRGVALDVSAARMPEAGLLGRKSGRGFYRYPKRGRRTVNQEVYRLFDVPARRSVARGEIVERLLLALVNEAVYCRDEGIIGSADDGDAGAVFGFGFPPFLGGPFHYLTEEGAAAVVGRLRELQARHGERFRPASGLLKQAGEG